MTLLLGSFGASAVLLYGFPQVPFSQPRNTIGGHLVAATVGITIQKMMNMGLFDIWLAAPIGVSLATMLMIKTNTVHPPAGGTALIAILGSSHMISMGYGLLVPTALGASSLVISSWAMNNMFKDRKYPKDGWF